MPTSIKTSPSRLRLTAAALLASSLASISSAVDYSSEAVTGDFFADSSWIGSGVPITGTNDRLTIGSGADITLSGTFAGTASSVVTLAGGNLTVADGGALSGPTGGTVNVITFTSSSVLNIEAGGSVTGGRIGTITTAETLATINIAGSLTLTPTSSTTSPYALQNSGLTVLTFNVSTGGLFRQNGSAISAFNVQSNRRANLNVSGGTYEYSGATDIPLGNNDGGNGRLELAISSGRFDIGGRNLTWNAAETNTFSYTGGTLANFYGVTDQGMRDLVAANFGNSAAKTIDINNQRVAATAQTLDLGTADLTASLGTLQFDIYGTTTADQLIGAGVFDLESGVLIDIGYAGGLINATALNGQTYQLFDLTDYSGLDATVASTVWDDGTQSYNVAFTNNLATNGTITISSLTAIPEPSSFALAFGATALLFASQTRRRRA